MNRPGKKAFPWVAGVLLLILIPFSCSKKGGTFIPDFHYGYFPVQVGKYLTYSLDSLIYLDYNGTVEDHHYTVRDVYESEFSDNLGRPSYLVTRYILDTLTLGWDPNITYYITPSSTRIEDIEQNLRFVKLVFPVQLNYSWAGNEYIAPDPNAGLQYLDGWTYTYTGVDIADTVGTTVYDSTATVLEADDSASIQGYAFRLYSREVYARNIGLVYRHFIHWEQQCSGYDQNGNCQGLDPRNGVEVTMELLDHN